MKLVEVNEQYQTGYRYPLSAEAGREFDPDFKPELTPAQMLRLGVFGGCYFHEVPEEFPAEWFEGVELTQPGRAKAGLNYFKVNASQPGLSFHAGLS